MKIPVGHYLSRVRGRYQRDSACLFGRRRVAINCPIPLVSFTFDDFPRSALYTGGAILRHFGLAGTYYTSLGLMGKQTASGTMFLAEDLKTLLQQRHELGCHTFDHFHSWETKPDVFEDSIVRNQLVLKELLPGASFKTFSYPISPPRVLTKRRVARHFTCSRGGGQTFNAGTADLNYLLAYFLEQSGGKAENVKDLIDQNRRVRGWLIFATHDISDSPTPYGCTPHFFEDIVQYTIKTGARILPIARALEVLGIPHLSERQLS